MEPQSDEHAIRKLLQRMKSEDQQHFTSFDDLLLRQARVVDARPTRHLWVIAACGAAAALLVGCAVMLGDWIVSDQDPREGLARESTVEETHPANLDFTELRGAIDQYFVPVTVPEWKTPSDSLLAMDFDISFSQE